VSHSYGERLRERGCDSPGRRARLLAMLWRAKRVCNYLRVDHSGGEAAVGFNVVIKRSSPICTIKLKIVILGKLKRNVPGGKSRGL